MKTLEEIKEYIEERGYDEVCVFSSPSYAEAFIGISHDGRAVYSYEKMIQSLMEEDECSEEDAIEFISYNTIRSLIDDTKPIEVYDL